MPKRKAVVETKRDVLDVSPQPAGLLEEDSTANGTLAKRSTPKRKGQKRTYVEDEELDHDTKAIPKRTKKRKVEVEEEKDVKAEVKGDLPEKTVKRKRKTKEDNQVEAMPLAERTLGHKLFIGAHVSSAGGQYNLRRILRKSIIY